MAFWEEWRELWQAWKSFQIQRLRRYVSLFVLVTVPGLLALVIIGRASVSAMEKLFRRDKVTRMASVELWVVLTTLMLVIRFLLDFFGPWYANRLMARIVLTIEMLNYSLVHYTMGLMQLSAARVNDYFQVWAVLLVTLQHSVKTGRPYSRSKQIPLLDLMSSFWAANLIRVQTFLLLRILLWLIWAINALRIIYYFSSSYKAEQINQESMRLAADYMSYEHELGGDRQLAADAADPRKEFTMKWYRYMVLGEDKVLQDQHPPPAPAQPQPQPQHQRRRKRSRCQLDPQVYHKLVTVDKIWDAGSSSRDNGGLIGRWADQLKDVCLSFALYKLQRRRFFDLPIHEARLPAQLSKTRRLVFEYILHDAERAFRVMATELSFLQDLFYSKHAALFADGFPAMHLVLALLLVAATGYIAYPIRYIPERDGVDDSITHGVLITHVIVALIICKEMAEIYMYVFSQWTKVLMLCNYVVRVRRRRCCCRHHPLVEKAARVLLGFMTRGSWNEKIRQHNLLISSRAVKVPRCGIISFPCKFPSGIKMEACTKNAIFESLKKLEQSPERLDSYFSNAFGGMEDEAVYNELRRSAVDGLEADTHRILVWHIATCLCEIKLCSDEAAKLHHFSLTPMPLFVNRPPNSMWWDHYITAASLSNYCAYLVTQGLVPDNGLVSKKVFLEVRWEINQITLKGGIRNLLRRRSMKDVFTSLMNTVSMPEDDDENKERKHSDPHGIRNSLARKGARLGDHLMAAFREPDSLILLWERLATFWAGFLLHLAASTRAGKHRMRLAGSRELSTHLWALLSHAGFLGNTIHGQVLLDPEDLQDVNPLD